MSYDKCLEEAGAKEVAENKLSIEQLKQIREALEIVIDKCPRDYQLNDKLVYCYKEENCTDCWRKIVDNELKEREEAVK